MEKFEPKIEGEKNMKIEVTPSGDNNLDKVILEILDKYDLTEIVSQATGLKWYKDKIYLKNKKEGTADWEGDDTILDNYEHGVWIVSGIAHELVHLILRQNNWFENKIVSDFVKKHPEIIIQGASEKRGDGYCIEQIIAYLLQADVLKDIGRKEEIEEMASSWDEEKFEKIISSEYKQEFKEKLARFIIEKWKIREDDINLIEWIEGVLLEMD